VDPSARPDPPTHAKRARSGPSASAHWCCARSTPNDLAQQLDDELRPCTQFTHDSSGGKRKGFLRSGGLGGGVCFTAGGSSCRVEASGSAARVPHDQLLGNLMGKLKVNALNN
jgi:hypothetical protein